jgi:hypothetical protein
MRAEVTLSAIVAEPALIDELAVEELSPLAQPAALQTAVAAPPAALDSKAAS